MQEAKRFQHFSERFLNQGQLEKDAEKKMEECITVWQVQYREETGGLDPTFLLESLELLIRCRHVLKFTYVYAWFLDEAIKELDQQEGSSSSWKSQANDSREVKRRYKALVKRKGTASSLQGKSEDSAMLRTKQELFNFQQANLEGITERLGRLLFSGQVVSNAESLKNLMRVTHKYLQGVVNFLQDIMDDIEDDL